MSKLKVLYEEDCDLNLLKDKMVAVIGYGSQGHAHALNLADSGVQVVVGLREDSKSRDKAKDDGLEVMTSAEAARAGDLVVVLTQEHVQKDLWENDLAPNMKAGDALVVAHGFNILYGQIIPPPEIDVIMMAPKCPGHIFRRMFTQGRGVPGLLAVEQDATGNARALCLAYGKGVGCARAGIIETTFKDETESDLFGEQAVLCGGTDWLIRRGFKVLTEAGYPPEIAYFEVLNELKLIVDLIYKSGISGMYAAVSDTAKFGGMTVGPMIIDDHVEDNMRAALKAIQNGDFAKGWVDDYAGGSKEFQRLYDECKNLEVEKVGKRVRQMSGLEE